MKYPISFIFLTAVLVKTFANKPMLSEIVHTAEKNINKCFEPLKENAKSLENENATEFENNLNFVCNPKFLECVYKFNDEIKNIEYEHSDFDVQKIKEINFYPAILSAVHKTFCFTLKHKLEELGEGDTLKCYDNSKKHAMRCLVKFSNYEEDTRSENERREFIFSDFDCKSIKNQLNCAVDQFLQYCSNNAIEDIVDKIWKEVLINTKCDHYEQ